MKAAASSTRDVTIDVLSADGQPVAGALVTGLLVDVHGRPLGGQRRLSSDGELGVLSGALPRLPDVLRGEVRLQTDAAATAVSDSTGRARLHISLREHGGAALRLQVVASHNNLDAISEVVLAARAPGSVAPETHVVLRLKPAAAAASGAAGDELPAAVSSDESKPDVLSWRGIIHDERGRALPAATVELLSRTSALASAFTDQHGQYQLAGTADPREPLLLRVRRAGYVTVQRPLTADDPAWRSAMLPLIELSPGGGIEGEVRDARQGGAPARVQLFWQADQERTAIPISRDGRFRMTGLRPGAGMLIAQAPGYAPQRRLIDLPAGSAPDTVTVRDARLELARAVVLSGLLRGSGELGGVAVQVLQADEQGTLVEVGHARSNARREFRVNGLPEGPVRVVAQAAGGRAEAEVTLQAGREGRVELEFR